MFTALSDAPILSLLLISGRRAGGPLMLEPCSVCVPGGETRDGGELKIASCWRGGVGRGAEGV